jgi:ubiquitin C-terminal hydrolase
MSNLSSTNKIRSSGLNGGGLYSREPKPLINLMSNDKQKDKDKENLISKSTLVSNGNEILYNKPSSIYSNKPTYDKMTFDNYSLFDSGNKSNNNNNSIGNSITNTSMTSNITNLYSFNDNKGQSRLNNENRTPSTNSHNIYKESTIPNDYSRSIQKSYQQTNSIQIKTVGLDNLGNTCYMNSSLQCLFHNDLFIKRLLKESEEGIHPNITSTAYKFIALCNEMIKKSDSTIKSSISPNDFKRTFGHYHSEFEGYSQHDSQEFLRKLLEDISSDLNRVKSVPEYKELDHSSNNKVKLNKDFDSLFRRREDSVVIDTFYGQIVNIFKCSECDFENYSFEKFLEIPILLDTESYEGLRVDTLLKKYFQGDSILFSSPCENKMCRKKSEHDKIMKISLLPDILILSFQRYNSRSRRKNSSKIIFDEQLDMREFVDGACSKKILIS